ncbi:ATP-binding protein, partial [Crocosphaera sp. Alani8]|uniref:ATP-binding protein n=1 Tax=Crocosphaera sp. Alani8 TaxID=3038952 RepID=UPI00313C2763
LSDRSLVFQQFKQLSERLGVELVPLTISSSQENPDIASGKLYLLDEFPTLLDSFSGVEQYQIIQWLISLITQKRNRCSFILTNGIGQSLPDYLLPLIPSVNWPLPNLSELKTLLNRELGTNDESLAVPLAGLSTAEIITGLRLIDPSQAIKPQLLSYKQQQLSALGLNFLRTPNHTVGGLDLIKTAISQVAIDYSDFAQANGIPFPKGWLFAGPPGTGKTFTAKICAVKLGFPLISVGVDIIKSKGAAYLKQLLLRIESASPAVCYFDEFDKFFDPDTALNGGSNSQEVLGVLLTWLQEKQTKTFVIATLNRLDALPPELTRAGRFDRIFYVGFPQAIERFEILKLHANRFDSRYSQGELYFPLTQQQWAILLNRTQNFTGAELQALVEKAAKTKFYTGVDSLYLDLDDFLQARSLITPLYIRDTERVLAMENRARFVSEPSSSPDNSVFAPPQTNLWGEAC